MMHDLIHRLAEHGGEITLCGLFLLSIINLGIVGQWIWRFWRQQTDVDAFTKELNQLLRAGDLPEALNLSQESTASVAAVAFDGFLAVEAGLPAVQQALHTAIERERTRMEENLPVVKELGQIALLIGLFGSLCDLLATFAPGAPANASPVGFVSPLIGGLFVAMIAWFARSVLNSQVRRVIRDCNFVARLVLLSPLVQDGAVARDSDPQSFPIDRSAA